MVPVGDGWTAEEFKRACEDDWRSWGVHYNADACPEENLIGYCEGLSGGELIGASWDSASYTATLYYYTTGGITDPESNCTSRGGAYTQVAEDPVSTEPENSIGTCIGEGGPDGPPEMLGCMVPVGSSWTTDKFKMACEDDWDDGGKFYDALECPQENRIGSCEGVSGDVLIGASWEGDNYTAILFYYTTGEISDPEYHCTSKGGIYSPHNG